ncbi:hypothetical protein N7462_004244 [Penicillium macrosclerotiorum]|uniref:uncharacterized protein n=1 Tax=Penicillium macrosclerotiorum TaxID=303699 RepID=UPI0025467980|nr:uncharacterized protein N7462_004244 [Penicillium macrosclerotiorum]KAJ5689852.1 hypothetical protein N7462_004244 [Penicillium macrosclerotiorum]
MRPPTLPYASIDERVVPNLVSSTFGQQHREGFCAFVDARFSGIFYGFSTRVEVNWVEVARQQQGQDNKALDIALQCLGSLQLGQANSDERLVLQSREMYGRALQQLVRALNTPSLVRADKTLGASILLGLYEAVSGMDQNSWMLHSGGIGCLFQLRGAHAHVQGFARTLLVSFRSFLVFDAFMRGERCFLEDQKWRDIIPDIIKDEERRGKSSPLGELLEYAFYDISCCPGFLAKTRRIVMCPQEDESEKKDLTHRISLCREGLSRIQADMLAHFDAVNQVPQGNSKEFIGSIPNTAASKMGKFCLQGIESAVALLDQLLRVIRSNDSLRKSGASRSKFLSLMDPLALVNNAKTGITPEKDARTSPKPDSESMVTWHDRLCMSMGMMKDMPPN